MMAWLKTFFSSRPRADAAISKRATTAAGIAVDALEKSYGVVLDYSPDSLKLVDDTVLRMKEEGATCELAPMLVYATGCYVGEVMVKNLGAVWARPPRNIQATGIGAEAVATPDGIFWNPIGKVQKLLANGIEDSVYHLFQVMSANNSFKPKPLRGSA